MLPHVQRREAGKNSCFSPFARCANVARDGGGVARIVTRQTGIIVSDWKETNRLRELQEEIAAEKGILADTLHRLPGKVDEYSERASS